eukprot:TRINITY_DN4160_c0_g1_i2.p1 TRINITY_DN4160_c0_g1~~TRINITY_DN4160_c0_g1_i2.p1  ORF type:complete len:565 (+),score=136.54 TRINITY_DN4160_c0_g1_i2:178-1872(+)
MAAVATPLLVGHGTAVFSASGRPQKPSTLPHTNVRPARRNRSRGRQTHCETTCRDVKLISKSAGEDESAELNADMIFASGFVSNLLSDVVQGSDEEVVYNVVVDDDDCESDENEEQYVSGQATASLLAQLNAPECVVDESDSEDFYPEPVSQLRQVSADEFNEEIFGLEAEGADDENMYADFAEFYIQGVVQMASSVRDEGQYNNLEATDLELIESFSDDDEAQEDVEAFISSEDFVTDYVSDLIDSGIDSTCAIEEMSLPASSAIKPSSRPSSSTVRFCPSAAVPPVRPQEFPSDCLSCSAMTFAAPAPPLAAAQQEPVAATASKPRVQPIRNMKKAASTSSFCPSPEASRTRRRIIGGVLREASAPCDQKTQVDTERPTTSSSSGAAKREGSLAGSAGSSLRVFRQQRSDAAMSAMAMDLDDNAEDSAAARGSSLVRGYDSLGKADFFHMDASSRANSPAWGNCHVAFSKDTTAMEADLGFSSFSKNRSPLSVAGSISLKSGASMRMSKSSSMGALVSKTQGNKDASHVLPALRPASPAGTSWSRSSSRPSLGLGAFASYAY